MSRPNSQQSRFHAKLLQGQKPVRRGGSRAVLAAAAAASLMFVLPTDHSSAQVMLRARAPINGPGGGAGSAVDQGREDQQGVSVKDSPEALKELDTAASMARQKDWTKAAGWYQQVLTKYSDRVVPCHVDRNNVIDQYRSITSLVQESLSKWPAEGLNAYRALYAATAASQLDQAGQDDLAGLSRVFETYFITDAGKTAGIRLMNLYMEDGDFAGAAWIGSRLIDWHPNLTVEQPRVMYRTALAHHLAGDDAEANALLDKLQRDFPTATDSVFGKDVVLATALKDQLAVSPVTASASDASSWPMFYGDPSRTRLSQGGGQARARYYALELSQEHQHVNNRRRGQMPPQQQQQQIEEAQRSQGMTLGIFPVVDRGQMFFQNGANCFAVDLNTGLPLPGWAKNYPSSSHCCYTLPGARAQHTSQYTLTVTEDSVIAVMGSEAAPTPYYQQGNITRNTAIVCLDRQTGAQKWIVRPKDLPGDLASLDFSGSPLVVGNNVYVMAHGGKTAEFEDSQVLCLDLNTGLDARTHAPIWSSFIASATTGLDVYWGGAQQQGPNYHISHLSYSSGRVYALSDVGALAALDAYTGSVAWLSIYPRDIVNDAMAARFGRMRRGTPASNSTVHPWEYNPVFEQDGKLFILPTDCAYVLIYDAASGKELERLNRADFGNARTLLGVVGDRLLLCDDMTVWAVLWKKYVPRATTDAEKDQYLSWREAEVSEGGAIRGRGFITADSVFIPREKFLAQLNLANGDAPHHYPPNALNNQTWDDQEGPGNVLVTPDYVIVAGARHLDVYTDLALAKSKLEAEIAAAPNDSGPWLRYAGMMFSAGRLPEAAEKMERAAALEGGWDHLRGGLQRDNLFTRSLDFAQKLAKQKRKEVFPFVDQFYEMARTSAQSPAQQVEYRLDRAQFETDRTQPVDAIRYYQEILSDPSWRGVALGDAQGQVLTRQAGALAERKIGELKTAHPGDYAAVDAQAHKEMDAIRAAYSSGSATGSATGSAALKEKAEKLLALATTYPNSSAAPKAMIAAVAAWQEAGNLPQATQIAREAFMKYGDEGEEQAQVVETLVRNALLQPDRIDVAIGRLRALCQQGSALTEARLSAPLQLPNGQVLEKPTFLEALTAIEHLKFATVKGPSLDMHMPVHSLPGREMSPFKPETADDRLGGVLAMLSPPDELRDFNRYDRLVVWREDGLAVYPAGKAGPNDKPLLTSNVPGHAKGIAWLRDSAVIVPAAAAAKPSTESSAAAASTAGQPAEQPATAPAIAVKVEPPHSLLVWSEKGLALMTPSDSPAGAPTSPRWHATLASLSPLKIVDAGLLEPSDDSKDEDSDSGTYVEHVGNQTIVHVQNRFVQVYVDNNGPDDQQEEAGVPPNDEKIEFVRPTGSTVVVATNTGRVFCLRQSDGQLLWQTRLGNHSLKQLCVNSDFAVARFARGSGPEATEQMVVLDTFDGRVLSSKTYDTITGNAPVNMALSPDGLLVWTVPDAMFGKDLYEGGEKLTDHLKFSYYVGEKPNENAAQRNQRRVMRMQMGGQGSDFSGCDQPDQLIIADDRILAVEQQGSYFTIFSAENGKPLAQQETRTFDNIHLQTYPGSTNHGQTQASLETSLRYIAPYVDCITTRGIMQYNLDNIAGDQCTMSYLTDNGMPLQNIRSYIDQHSVVVIAPMTSPRRVRGHRGNVEAAATPPHWYRLFDFRRSGVNVADPDIKDNNAAITQWEACDGGFYYLTDDHVLHFRAGVGG